MSQLWGEKASCHGTSPGIGDEQGPLPQCPGGHSAFAVSPTMEEGHPETGGQWQGLQDKLQRGHFQHCTALLTGSAEDEDGAGAAVFWRDIFVPSSWVALVVKNPLANAGET